MKLRGGRGQIRSHRPQDRLFRVTYSCESEHWENVSNFFTKNSKIVPAKIVDVMCCNCDFDCRIYSKSPVFNGKCSHFARNG